MTDENNKELSLQYLPFKGKKEDWEMWSAKFLSKAQKKKYQGILTGEIKVTFGDEHNKMTEEKALKKLNEEANNDLIISMEDKVAFSKVNQAKTNTLKGGCAHTARKNLLAK